MDLKNAVKQPVALYVHVPFCLKKCPYCAFYKTIYKEAQVADYLTAFQRECDAYVRSGLPVKIHSIFLGGGTPNALSPEDLNSLLEIIERTFVPIQSTIERTSELNPDVLSAEHLAVFSDHGFNRFSLGVQSFQPKILSFLGRSHTPEKVVETVEMIQKSGVHNINLDLIFSTPISTQEDLQKDIEQALSLNPTHLSTYALTIEDGTPFYRRGVQALSDDTELTHYDIIQSQLRQNGFDHYEVSAFAQPGYQSIHNLSYWQLTPYIGLGPSASSYLHRHYQNPADLSAYCSNPDQVVQDNLAASPDPVDQEKADFWLTNLRLRVGVSKLAYERRFGQTPSQEYGEKITQLVTQGWLEVTATHIRATDSGLALLNDLLVELVG